MVSAKKSLTITDCFWKHFMDGMSLGVKMSMRPSLISLLWKKGDRAYISEDLVQLVVDNNKNCINFVLVNHFGQNCRPYM